mmetsp:Transcript_30494/g.53564  ORF Transcript_30494/g.53564 Transcript_30494/m.53564 type:complete len:200 (+) Transcript_30494:2-601(+)
MKDSTSPCCPLCDATFSMVTRRHHCRACGTLACGQCSKKKVGLRLASKDVRTCDICFNKLALGSLPKFKDFYGSKNKNAAPSTTKKKQGPVKSEFKQPAKIQKMTAFEKRMLRDKNPETAREKKAFRDAIAKKYGIEVKKSKPNVSATSDLVAQNMDALKQRGEQLKETEDAAEKMSNEARGFAEVAKKLRQQQEKRWI